MKFPWSRPKKENLDNVEQRLNSAVTRLEQATLRLESSVAVLKEEEPVAPRQGTGH